MDGLPIAAIQPAAATISALHTDNIGTVQRATNAAKTQVWTMDYSPCGAGTPTTTITQDLRFPGQINDASGLNHNGARDMSKVFCTYFQSEPLGLAPWLLTMPSASVNGYPYALNNPITNTDPSGLCLKAPLSKDCLNALLAANANAKGLERAYQNWSIIQQAANGHGLDPNMLAAVALRESNFQNVKQRGSGAGAGVFQIDTGKNPSVTADEASNLLFSANFAANMLANNFYTLALRYPAKKFNGAALLQATAASYNEGLGNISGNPATIDQGTTGNNYGLSVLNLMNACFD
jgi:RHS repeat-associated protein